jgi:hypothetical protein
VGSATCSDELRIIKTLLAAATPPGVFDDPVIDSCFSSYRDRPAVLVVLDAWRVPNRFAWETRLLETIDQQAALLQLKKLLP